MSVFQDTWKLNLDTSFIAVLEHGDAAAEELDNSLTATAKAAAGLDKATGALGKEATKTAKALERDAAKAARELAKAEKLAAKEAKDLAKALDAKLAAKAKKAEKSLENTKKAIEGIGQTMGIAALGGERLGNVYLAVGAAAGAVAAGGLALIKGALTTYIAKNEEAKKGAENLKLAWEQLEMASVEMVAGTDGVTASLDRNTARLNTLAAGVESVDKWYGELDGTTGLLTETFIDFGLSHLPIIGNLYEMAKGASQLVDAFDDLTGTEDQIAKDKALREHNEGLLNQQQDLITASNETAQREIDNAAKSAKFKRAAARKAQAAEDAREAGARAAAKRRKRETDREIAELEASRRKEHNDILADEDKFAADSAALKKKNEEAAIKLAQAAAGLSVDTAGGAAKKAADAPKSIEEQQLESLDAAFGDFANGNILNATDALTDLASAMVLGDFNPADFGRQQLAAIGGLLENLGKSAIAAGMIGQWFQAGGLFSNPAFGIPLGLAALTLGKVMQSGASLGSGGGSQAGSTPVSTSAARVTRQQRQTSDDRDSRSDAPIILMMDRQKMGEAMRRDGVQAARRGQFNLGGTLA